MATKYLLAHDFGTSGDKASLFTTEGKFVATKTTGYPSITLSNGGVEQDPDEWWTAFCNSTKELTKDIDVKDIIAVGFDGTFPKYDATGAAIGYTVVEAEPANYDATVGQAEVDDATIHVPVKNTLSWKASSPTSCCCATEAARSAQTKRCPRSTGLRKTNPKSSKRRP